MRKQITRTATARTNDARFTLGSDNIFADLGFENPVEELAKSTLAIIIDRVIHERGLTQRAAAALMGTEQQKISHLLRGRFGEFSTQQLMEFLTALGHDVDIVVRRAPRSRKRGRLHIAAPELSPRPLV